MCICSSSSLQMRMLMQNMHLKLLPDHKVQESSIIMQIMGDFRKIHF
jgi:hypothetical protein